MQLQLRPPEAAGTAMMCDASMRWELSLSVAGGNKTGSRDIFSDNQVEVMPGTETMALIHMLQATGQLLVKNVCMDRL
jgi:hypothetical protein